MAARCAGVGVPQHAEERAAAECHLRVLPRGMPLCGRHLYPGQDRRYLPEDGSAQPREVHLLAPGPDHHARVDLVSQPGRALLQHQPGHRPVQQGLTSVIHRAGRPAARPAARMRRWCVHMPASVRSAVRSAPTAAGPVPGRRGLQICLGLIWLLDAALQYQPFMFGPGFVTKGIEPAAAGNPLVIVSSVTWASHVMLAHVAVYNAMFASIQLLLAIGFFFRRTVQLALAASIIWALSIWWFGESLGGILTGTSPLAGLPGAVVLYALIAIVLWPNGSAAHEPTSAAAAGALGPAGANF